MLPNLLATIDLLLLQLQKSFSLHSLTEIGRHALLYHLDDHHLESPQNPVAYYPFHIFSQTFCKFTETIVLLSRLYPLVNIWCRLNTFYHSKIHSLLHLCLLWQLKSLWLMNSQSNFLSAPYSRFITVLIVVNCSVLALSCLLLLTSSFTPSSFLLFRLLLDVFWQYFRSATSLYQAGL